MKIFRLKENRCWGFLYLRPYLLFLFLQIALLSVLWSGCSSVQKEEEGPVVDTKNKAAEYTSFGNQYYENAQYEQALKFFELALKQNISVDNETGIASSYNSIGKVYLAVKSPEMAEQYFSESIKIAERLNDYHLLLQSINNLTEISIAKQDYLKADQYALEGAAYEDVDERPLETAILYHNTAVIRKKQERFEEAESLLNQALDLNRSNNEIAQIASNYYLLATVYSKQGKYQEAEEYGLLALENDKLIENSPGIAADLYALGIYKKRDQQYPDAYEYFQKSYMVYKTLNLLKGVIKTLDELIELAEQLNATEDLEAYLEIKAQLEIIE